MRQSRSHLKWKQGGGGGEYRTSLWDSQQVGRKVVSMATNLHSSKSQQVGGKVVSMVTWLL